jgi:hypothetical protein
MLFIPSFVYLFLLLYQYEQKKRQKLKTDRTTICLNMISNSFNFALILLVVVWSVLNAFDIQNKAKK